MSRWLLLLSIWTTASDGAKILAFFPFPAKSHHLVFGPLTRELALRGHQVTAVTPFPMADPPPGYEEIIVPDVMEDLIRRMNIKERGSMNFIKQAMNFAETGYHFQSLLCRDENIRRFISTEARYDAVLLESYFIQEIFSVLQHRFSATAMIEVLPCQSYPWANHWGGNPYNPAYVLDMKSGFGEPMGFLERLKNTLSSWGSVALFHAYYLPMIEPLFESCFDYEGSGSRAGLGRLMADRSLLLSNAHFSVNFAVPAAPHFVEVAGLNIRPNKTLPADIQKFMDEAEHGVVYFSLGSNLKVSDVANGHVFGALVSAFGKIEQRVLWKWEIGDFPGRPPNVMISKWFPQQDILAHKNCQVFITHGGLLSIIEAVHYGVPVIGIPFFGDQQKNVKHASTVGYGLQLSYDNITEESLLWSINQIVSNPSYRDIMKERSEIFRDRPMPAMETAIYWIEYAIRHRGAAHLRPALGRLASYKSVLLDVGAVIAAVLIAALALLWLGLRKIFRSFSGKIRSRKGENGN